MEALIRGHELALSVTLGQMLKGKKALTDAQRQKIENLITCAKTYLAYRALRINDPELALDLAKSLLEVSTS